MENFIAFAFLGFKRQCEFFKGGQTSVLEVRENLLSVKVLRSRRRVINESSAQSPVYTSFRHHKHTRESEAEACRSMLSIFRGFHFIR
jgi:hypothetical protein